MKLLSDYAPKVHKGFVQGNHGVAPSRNIFSKVWTDMVLEQTVNCDRKVKGNIAGFTLKVGALGRWFITAHEHSAITTYTKVICDILDSDVLQAKHKEVAPCHMQHNEGYVSKAVPAITNYMTNP